MAESEPTLKSRPKDERDELKLLEDKLAQKRVQVEGFTNFGKYDEEQGPLREGEMRYHEYVEGRPSEGVIRDGDGFREAHTGKFATEDAYDQQTAGKNEILDMLNNPGEAPDRDYQMMPRMELVKKAAEAMVLGDRAEVDDIRSAFEHNLMEEFTNPDAGRRHNGADYSDEAYQAELANFDRLVTQMADKSLAEEGPEASEAESQQQEEKEETNTGENNVESLDDRLEINVGDKVQYKDRDGNIVQGTVRAVIELDNEDYLIYHIETDEGKKVFVSYADFVSEPVTPGSPGSEVPAKEGQSQEEYEAEQAGGQEGKPGKELELYKGPRDASGEGGEDDDKVNNLSDLANKERGSGPRFGNYPELYAQRKNLASGKESQEKLEAEGKRVAESISNEVWELTQDFIEHNPEATEEQIRHAMMAFFVTTENALQREIIDHIDGRKVDGQEKKGLQKGLLRRFGALMDSKIGKGIKIGLLAGGLTVGAVTLGPVLAAGGTVGLAWGAGTAIGAAKGMGAGGILTRHGSKNSASRKVSVESEQAKGVVEGLDPTNRETFDAVSTWIVSQRDEAAKQDNARNRKKTAIGAGLGAVFGAVAGSLEVSTPTTETITNHEPVPGEVPELVSHQIASGELTGQVLNKLMADSGINLADVLQANNITGYGDSFTLPDGSTNVGLIHAVENALGANFGEVGVTHSFAGADALSDPGIRSIAEAVSSHAAGDTTLTDVTTTITGSEVNEQLTQVVRDSALAAGSGLAALIADRVARDRRATERVEVEG